jgi:hypothetical protein
MAAIGLSPSELAARLVIEGSLDKIAGKATGKFPIEGVRLTDAQRAELGRQAGGNTLLYSIGASSVFIDFQDAATTVWFTDADSTNAMRALEKALKSAYPKSAQKQDKPHDTAQGLRFRSYDVPLGADRAATVDVAYPAPKSTTHRFVVRIVAFAKGPNRT